MTTSRARRTRTVRASTGYPWDAVLLAMLLVAVIVTLGSFAVDAAGSAHWNQQGMPTAAAFRSTCYWLGDTHNLIRIAGNGYTDYWNSGQRHLSLLPDRSWWPVFPALTALMLRLTGGDYCSNWLVNLVAMILLPPVIQGITRTRRPLLLIGVALLPFAVWLYTGISEGTLLLFSGLLWWLCLRDPGARWRANALAGLGALALGIIIGLTKPNALALIPGFAVLGLRRSLAARGSLRLLSDANPGWAGLLGAIGIAVGLCLWFYQTSGYYPLYVLMAQRTLWHREFDARNVLAFSNVITMGWRSLGGEVAFFGARMMLYFAALLTLGIVLARDVPPRWPGAFSPRRVPVEVSAALLGAVALMIASGQVHSFDRYLMGNVFFVVSFLRNVYGSEDEPPLAALPVLVRARRPDSLRAALRLTLFACSLCLLVYQAAVLIAYGE